MFERFRFVSVFALVSGVAVTTLSANAFGQTVSMSTTNAVVRDPVRSSNTTDSTVALTMTRGDCKSGDDVTYTFNVNVAGYKTGWVLEAWAGQSDCASLYGDANRGLYCWKLGTVKITSGTASAQYHPEELFGVGTKLTRAILPNSCDDTVESSARQSFNVYFILVYSNTAKASATQALWYDLSGPDAPAIKNVGAAENALKVEWDAVSNEEGEISYQLYCAGTASASSCESETNSWNASNGGAGGEGGTGGTSTTTTTAGNASVGGSGGAGSTTSGTTTTSDTTLGGSAGSSTEGTAETSGTTGTSTTANTSSLNFEKCGTVQGLLSESSFTNANLTNGKTYAVAVAAIDAYGNEGAKSEALCGTPQYVDTFFEHYRNKGGKAGGSFCSFVYGNRQLSTGGLFLLSLGAIATLRRRRTNANL
jgi:hypothetical protein